VSSGVDVVKKPHNARGVSSVGAMKPDSSAAPVPVHASLALEIERQWCVSRGLRLPTRLGRWEAVSEQRDEFSDSYFDTPLLCLGGRRTRLRIRASATGDVATLKRRLAGGGRARRKLELQAPAGEDPYASAPFLAARLITDRPLGEVGEILTRRTTRVYVARDATIEVVRDRVDYAWGETVWRVEAEGHEPVVQAFAEELERAVVGLRPVRQGKAAMLFERYSLAA
jgi:CYTH domain